MSAEDILRNIALSRINYFNADLEKGNKDPLKTLIKTVLAKESSNNISAKNIARIIQTSYNELGKNRDTKSKAIVKAAEKLTGRSKLDSYQEDDFKEDVAAILKGYDFINSILKNIPNKAAGVLESNCGKFSAFKSATPTGDKIESAQYYFDVTVSPCGARPFLSGAELPNAETGICLDQIHTTAYTLLKDINCGRDKLDCFEVKESCYYALADKLYKLYNNGNIDDMMIDLSAKYPVIFVDPKPIEILVPNNEINECLRAKKKQAEEIIEKLVQEADIIDGVDLEAIKYNTEVLDNIVSEMRKKRELKINKGDEKKNEINDWLIYAKEQMEEKDREIKSLKAQLNEAMINEELSNKPNIVIKSQEEDEEL